MEVQSTRFGTLETVEVPEAALFVFPEGVPGFPDHHAFALIEDERQTAFSWLQSLHDPSIVFTLIKPEELVTAYEPAFNDQALESLQLTADGVHVDIRCIVVFWEDQQLLTANLKAPVLLNRKRQLGKQVILSDDRYPLRHPIALGGSRSVA